MSATENNIESDQAQRHSLENLDQKNNVSDSDSSQNLNVVQNIKVTLSMELGRTMISIKELLQLNQGSVIELDRMVDEPMDVLVNGTLVAHGEVVVIDDKFGIRLTDIVNPIDRVKQL